MSSEPVDTRTSAPAGSAGAWVLVAGPSGAGKDTLIDIACREFADDPRIRRARRVVTRQPNAFEDHETVSDAAFEALRSSGQLSLSWQAHGLSYGIGRQWQDAVNSGCIVIANVSRTILGEAREMPGHVKIVLVTAPKDVLIARVAARGREPAAGERVSRDIGGSANWYPDLTIENTSSPDDGAAPLIALLNELNERLKVT